MDGERPELAEQHDTSVVGSHRGHRLGAAAQDRHEPVAARRRSRSSTEISTWNAESNDHMIGVNEAIGYRIMGRELQLQKSLVTRVGRPRRDAAGDAFGDAGDVVELARRPPSITKSWASSFVQVSRCPLRPRKAIVAASPSRLLPSTSAWLRVTECSMRGRLGLEGRVGVLPEDRGARTGHGRLEQPEVADLGRLPERACGDVKQVVEVEVDH